jgi:hypothetical protein
MRHAAHRIASLLAMFVITVLAACGGGGGSESLGDVESRRASCIGYDHVYITVQRVRVLQRVNGLEQWTEVALPASRRVDLMNSGGLLQALGATLLAAGHYTEVRLILAADDSGLAHAAQPIGGSEAALNAPSGAHDGLKLIGDFVVPSGQNGDVVLQGFDACQAVTQAGNSGKYNLKPELSAGVQLQAMPQETRLPSGSITVVIGGGYAVSRQVQPNVFALQRYGADGQPAGPEVMITVPTDPSDPGVWTRIAPLTGGGYAVLWMNLVEFQRFGGSIYQLSTQGFTAAGTPIGSPVPIAQTAPASDWISRPAAVPQVAALTGGGYAVVWAKSNTGPGVHVQRFNADGTPAGSAQNASPFAGGAHLGITGLSTGGYLATWGTYGTPEVPAAGGGARAYSSTDVPLGPEQTAGASWAFPEDTGPGVAAPLAGGSAVLVWQFRISTAFVQQLAPDGTPLTSQRSVDDSIPGAGAHSAPSAAGLPDGGYVVAWIEAGEVHARRFAADGAPLGVETRINLVTTSAQGPTTMVPMASGGFMITWSGVGADGIRANYARVFPANGLLATP